MAVRQTEYPFPSNPRFTHFGYSDSLKDCVYGSHFHHGFEFIFIAEGKAKIELKEGEAPVILSADDLCIVPPRTVHEFIYRDESLSFYWMGYQTGNQVTVEGDHMQAPRKLLEGFGKTEMRIAAEAERAALALLDRDKAYVIYSRMPRIASIFRDIDEEILRRDAFSSSLCSQRVLELFLLIARQAEMRKEPDVPDMLRYAAEFLKSRGDRAVSLGELSDRLGYSREHFSREFKKRYSVSPKSYHNRYRLERAKSALARGQSVAGAAADCGFLSSSQFSKWFRSKSGDTPERYKEITSS